MKILITTGIYPPKIGGPAQYAKNLKKAFEKIGHSVAVKTFTLEDKMPTGLRHFFFFLKIIPNLIRSDAVFALDTYGVGFPTAFASRLFFKTNIIRTGGDFLWEQYCERHKKKVLFKNFYNTEKENFTLKEKIIFLVTKWTLNNASKVIFSTEWQRDIFIEAYKLSSEKTSIVENYYGEKESDFEYESKTFTASSRNLVIKNSKILHEIFNEIKKERNDISLFYKNLPYRDFMEKMEKCFVVVSVSLSEISPNIILDAIRLNRPFICTKEVGIYERIKDAGIFVDPLNEKEIEGAVLNLLTEEGYKKAKEKVRNFNLVHTWDNIAGEFLAIANNLKK